MKTFYLVLSIIIIAALLAVFVVSYVLYKKTPVPAGCETMEHECGSCKNENCRFHTGEEDK